MRPTPANKGATVEPKADSTSNRQRVAPGVVVFVILSGVTALAAAVVGILLLLNTGAASPTLGAAALLERIGIQPPASNPSAWLGYLVLQLAAFEAFLAIAFWRRQPWAYPFLAAKGIAPVVFVLTTASPPWGGVIAGLIGASAILQLAFSRRVRAQFTR